MNALVSKLKEVLYAVLPITVIVLILNFTLSPLDSSFMIRFVIGAVLIIIGLSIFLIGVDIGITPIGQSMGATIAKSNKLWIVMIAGLLLGFFISIAEPDLHILAGQVDSVTSGLITKSSLVVVVSIGIGVLIATGLVRIVYNIPLYKLLTVLYLIIFVLALFTSPEFLAISFDASGATTGALTVPFILALALGVSMLKKDSKASEKDSFGLVAIASTGAIIFVMMMNIISKTDKMTGSLEQVETTSTSIIGPFIQKLPIISQEIIVALVPILLVFLVFQKISFKMSKKAVRKILIGLLFTFIGLVLFLVGVNAGFMDVGSAVGYNIASLDNKAYVMIVAFVLGIVTILAEPAVHVLTHQIEDVTSGYVKRNVVMGTLSIGVGLAVLLSIIRILIPDLQLWHYLLPGYVIAIALSYFVPKLFVGIAFDSGGVASGPMTATFILAFVQGAAEAIDGANVLIDGFGMIAMVAMTPLIALQILGLVFKLKSKKGGVERDVESF
ncbi:DUF1538 domain-containing protein [Lederbergia galactosidilytica]|uniref:Membrane protein n=1 Tax=Lederbergia galactosidilytica TaxID=217031 RepID=A0A178A641_9BACI|nr:DUF1538 domain-containing protein [Lederbergia galactosidilytica]KRG16172.1 membrane protein [Virgibacillus soli]MBP1914034.1 putative membrane protein YiaA [Lederbergia galactosidilytica]OAK75602.1 membrane protein [Lederbergia galactosidilytica]